MKFVVRPQRSRKPVPCGLAWTMCALCSEDPRFCGDEI